MDEDIEAVAQVIAARLERMEAAATRAPTPELQARARAVADSFREAAAGFLAEARTQAKVVAGAVKAYEERPRPAAVASPAGGPTHAPEDPPARELAARLAAEDFGHFGNRVYPPESAR